jgi:putative polyhydroxyalkanoate system protein
MSAIDVRRAHRMTKDGAKKLAEQMVRTMNRGADFDLRWDGDRLLFGASRGLGKGVRGTIDVTDNEVHVQIDLPMHLRMAKGILAAKLNERLAQLSAS